ncbi:MAG: PEP-CTERM sorting domain-containing protein [Phycisphaerae bacterium]|nr:PEP-CTERM sorting domain-containing protein [Phycisphaerae bacterium]
MKNVTMCVLALFVTTSIQAAPDSFFTLDDPVGDQTGLVDVVRMDFSFDSATGDYTILLTADAANPFQGDFRININIFNPDTGTMALDPSYFTDTYNDYYSVWPVLTFTLTGTNTRLLSWDIGDRVASSNTVFGNPEGVSEFKSAVSELPREPLYRQDYIAVWDSAVIEGPFATVPVPGAFALVGFGLGFAGWLRRRRMP